VKFAQYVYQQQAGIVENGLKIALDIYIPTLIMSTFNEVINSGKTVLVDFSATWCGPCKMMEPILKELANITGPDVKIIKVDVDKNQGAAMTYQVQSVPTLIVFKNGTIKWRQSGVVPAQQLKSVIEKIAIEN
jgi:thioredoxin